MRQAGTIASVGLAASATLNTTVMPFILRGVTLYGINSVLTPNEERARAWQLLADHVSREQLAGQAELELQDTQGQVQIIRGALDTQGVKNRKQARSRYGAKKEKK